jgi:hypothetical protein
MRSMLLSDLRPAVPARLDDEAEPLERTYAEHDRYGAAIGHFTEAVRLAPAVSEHARKAARMIREVFIPELAQLAAARNASLERRPTTRPPTPSVEAPAAPAETAEPAVVVA